MARLGGDHGKSYSKLHKYGNFLRIRNHGTIVQVMANKNVLSKNPTFQRFFLSVPAQKDGFLNGCKSFIGLDRCHLKGQYGKVMLTDVFLDSNNNLFLMAIHICEAENLNSWR